MALAATLERMEEEITLKTLAVSIEDLTGAVRDGFTMVDRRFTALEERVDSIAITVSRTEDNIKASNEEMRGVHKVIDNLNVRVVRTEKALGF